MLMLLLCAQRDERDGVKHDEQQAMAKDLSGVWYSINRDSGAPNVATAARVDA